MASSRKPDDLVAHVSSRIAQLPPASRRLTLALSGGVDSVVLLDILAGLREPLDIHLAAFHLNHGISRHADEWQSFCADLCARLGVVYSSASVSLEKQPGESLEAVAREARYGEFARLDADYVVLAHHLDDQAETVLLQLLRGAGLRGLSAMPELRGSRGAPALLRPLLEISRAKVIEYAARRGLAWIDDDSNANLAFDRNFLRHRIFPELEPRFPGYRQALLRASRHAAESQALLDEMAAADGKNACEDGSLAVAALCALPALRAKNLLRWFLDRQGVRVPSAARLEEILRQAIEARVDAQVEIAAGDKRVCRYRGRLYVVAAVNLDIPADCRVNWAFQDCLEIPGGMLHFDFCQGEGISLAKLRAAPVTVRFRHGQAWLRPDCRRPSRSLKNLFQESAIPPWQRPRIPLLFSGERLVWAAGIGVDCDYRAAAGEAGVLANYLSLL